MSLSCTVNEILSLIFQNSKRSRDSQCILLGIIYYACTSTPVHQSAHNVKCLALPIPKIWLGQNYKSGSCGPDHASQGVVCHSKASTWYIPLHTKFGDSCFSRSGDMIANVDIENGSRDPDHALTGVVCHAKARIWYSLHVCKILWF